MAFLISRDYLLFFFPDQTTATNYDDVKIPLLKSFLQIIEEKKLTKNKGFPKTKKKSKRRSNRLKRIGKRLAAYSAAANDPMLFIVLLKRPMPSISQVTTSPSVNQWGGSMA